MNNQNTKSHSEKLPENIQLFEVNDEPSLVAELKYLLSEYGNYMFVELGLIAGKESFLKELENFPGTVNKKPWLIFVIAKAGDTAVGCVGIKKFDTESCEMKRMFVVGSHRGKGIGRLLCNFVITWCRESMYKRILLDTNLEMKEAITLYQKCGFKEIEPYCINENEHPVFMEYRL